MINSVLHLLYLKLRSGNITHEIVEFSFSCIYYEPIINSIVFLKSHWVLIFVAVKRHHRILMSEIIPMRKQKLRTEVYFRLKFLSKKSPSLVTPPLSPW